MWDSDYRNRQGGFEDMRSERSTSAPPPETTLYLGSVSGNVSMRLFVGMFHVFRA